MARPSKCPPPGRLRTSTSRCRQPSRKTSGFSRSRSVLACAASCITFSCSPANPVALRVSTLTFRAPRERATSAGSQLSRQRLRQHARTCTEWARIADRLSPRRRREQMLRSLNQASALRIKAGSVLTLQVHYTAAGKQKRIRHRSVSSSQRKPRSAKFEAHPSSIRSWRFRRAPVTIAWRPYRVHGGYADNVRYSRTPTSAERVGSTG